MSGILVTLLAAIVKALGQDVVAGVLQALTTAQARADEVALGQARQAAADANAATAAANATAATVAGEAVAEANAPRTVAGVVQRLDDGSA